MSMTGTRGPGRPKFAPTDDDRDLVRRAAAAGISDQQIALLIRHHDGKHEGKAIGERTMARHFGEELKRGRAEAHLNIGQSIYARALKGNTALLIWYSKAQMNWRDTTPAWAAAGSDGSGNPAEALAAKLREAAKAIKAMEDAPPGEPELVHDADREEGAG